LLPEPAETDHSDADENPDDLEDEDAQGYEPSNFNIIAPAGRFQPARLNLTDFAGSGSHEGMRRGVGHYVHKGLQGSKNAVRRFGGTTQTAGNLYDALSALASGEAQSGAALDRTLLTGKSAQDIMTAIIEATRPVDGSQDTEAARDAMQRALGTMLEKFPEANLLDLTEEQRLFAIEQYLALDVFNRACLDLGKTILKGGPSATSTLARMREMREYIRQTIAAQFRKLRAAAGTLSARKVSLLAQNALREAFLVFEVSTL
jgi:hypothetical protein